MSSGYLRLHKLTKSYDGKSNAVDNVTIDIARGEFVTFLGPSGSGKTTTLLMIAGFETPTAGGIELGGRDLAAMRLYERSIGMVFQSYALFPHMTAWRNVVFPLRMRRFPKQEMAARVDRMLELVGLRQLAERYPRQLSGGQQQRVALARALVFDPDVLLLDEPLGALDKSLREQMQLELKRIHRELGMTMIYVTHDQSEAMAMSDRIAVFRHGALEQVGTPLEVYNSPVNRFVGEFIGDSNFFRGKVTDAQAGRIELDGIGPVRVERVPPSAGNEVLLMLRPERLQLLREGEMQRGDNVLDMVVEEVVHYGDSVLAVGKTHGLPLRVRIVGGSPDHLSRGVTVRLAWAAADARVLAG